MAELRGLWSYVHDDDAAEDGLILRLAKEVTAQYGLMTAETVDLFVDRDALEWGNRWRQTIDEGLANAAFFIAVITPRYFRSAACRDELQKFTEQAKKAGIPDIVLPLYYIRVPALHEDEPDDELVALIKERQWKDWRELRFEDPGTGAYRRAVAKLAERLVEANRTAEHADPAKIRFPEGLPGELVEVADATPGTIDKWEAAELGIPKLTQFLVDITDAMNQVGAATESVGGKNGEKVASASTMAERARLARALALALQVPAGRIQHLGSQFASELYVVDEGIRSMIETVAASDMVEEDEKRGACQFFAAIRQMAEAGRRSMTNVDRMIQACSPLERMSRDLRPPLRKIRGGLTSMKQATHVMQEWVNLISQANIDCPEES